MTTHNEAPPPAAQLSDSKIERETPVASKLPKHPLSLLMLTLLAISAAGYTIYANQALRHETTRQTNQLFIKINAINDQQTEANARLDSAISAANQSETNLKNTLDSFAKQLQSTRQQRAYQSNDWRLLKAQYCLELAQINAHWSDNLDTTVALLEQTNTLLTPFQDQGAFTLRQALTKEIAQLQSMPRLDVVGLLSQLDAVQAIVLTLPLKPVVPILTNTAITQQTNPSSWREYLKTSINHLEKLVIIRHHNETIQPLPSANYEAILRASIGLNLQQAEWAVLQKNEPIYQHSLTKALQIINQTFKPNTAAINLVNHQLQALQQTHLTLKKPIIDQLLQDLNELVESRKASLSTAAGEVTL